MTAKTFLSQAYRLDQRIYNMLEELEHLKSMATCVTAQLGGEHVQTSHNNSKLENSVIKIISQEEAINTRIGDLLDLKHMIRETISLVEDPDERLVLEERYINFRSWEKIAEDMSFSKRWVHTLHSRGLDAVDAIISKKNTP